MKPKIHIVVCRWCWNHAGECIPSWRTLPWVRLRHLRPLRGADLCPDVPRGGVPAKGTRSGRNYYWRRKWGILFHFILTELSSRLFSLNATILEMKGFQFFRGKYVTVFLIVSWIFVNIFSRFSRKNLKIPALKTFCPL